MVAPEHEKVFRILNFVGQEQADGFNGLFSSIHIVAQKQIVSLSRETSVFKQLDQVWELAVDVT